MEKYVRNEAVGVIFSLTTPVRIKRKYKKII